MPLEFSSGIFVIISKGWLLIDDLVILKDDCLLPNQIGKTFEKVLDTMYHRIAMLSPCMVMTCFMLPKQFWAYNNNEKRYYNMYDYADLLIVDETGQISVEIGAITFALAKKAVVVGDERQIPSVWSIRRALDISMVIKNGEILFQ